MNDPTVIAAFFCAGESEAHPERTTATARMSFFMGSHYARALSGANRGRCFVNLEHIEGEVQ
jgi:hypothetical protein